MASDPIVISYVPLLNASPGMHLTASDHQRLLETINATPEVRDLVWLTDQGQFLPIFAIDRGREVAEHLVAWAEGKPEQWFFLHVAFTSSGYVIALAPHITRSIDRYRVARRVLFGEVVPADTKFNVIFRTLRFSSDRPSGAARLALRKQMRVGIVDVADIDFQTLQLRTQPVLLGPFVVNPAEQPLGPSLSEEP